MNESNGTLSETLNALIRIGYTHNFNIQEDCIVSDDISLSPEDFRIDDVFRFDGQSDPAYQSVLYAISSDKYQVKGTLVNGYGIASDDTTSKVIEKLETHTAQLTVDHNSMNATKRRPEGERILNAPLVEIDLEKYMKQLKGESSWADSDRNSITVYKSNEMTIVLMALHKEAALKPHNADGPITVQVIEGAIEFTADQPALKMEKGHMIALQPGITHSVKALKDSCFLLTRINGS